MIEIKKEELASFRKKLYWNLAFLLQGLAIALCLLFWVSILYPLVLLAGAVLSIISLLLLLSFPYQKSRPDKKGIQGLETKAHHKNSLHWRFYVKAHATTRRILRALILSLFAMIASFGFMVILKGYSWLLYIRPIEREMNPYRKLYREGQKEFRKIQKHSKIGKTSLQNE